MKSHSNSEVSHAPPLSEVAARSLEARQGAKQTTSHTPSSERDVDTRYGGRCKTGHSAGHTNRARGQMLADACIPYPHMRTKHKIHTWVDALAK